MTSCELHDVFQGVKSTAGSRREAKGWNRWSEPQPTGSLSFIHCIAKGLTRAG